MSGTGRRRGRRHLKISPDHGPRIAELVAFPDTVYERVLKASDDAPTTSKRARLEEAPGAGTRACTNLGRCRNFERLVAWNSKVGSMAA